MGLETRRGKRTSVSFLTFGKGIFGGEDYLDRDQQVWIPRDPVERVDSRLPTCGIRNRAKAGFSDKFYRGLRASFIAPSLVRIRYHPARMRATLGLMPLCEV